MFACKERRIHMKFNNKFVKEDLVQVELFAEGSSSKDESKNTGACKNDTKVNVNGCAK
jgi:hypothetical protein